MRDENTTRTLSQRHLDRSACTRWGRRMRLWLSVAVVVGVAALPVNSMQAHATSGLGTHTSLNCELRSRANGLWVSAELGDVSYFYGMLRARASSVGLWESFECDAVGPSSWVIRSRATSMYASAELGYPASLYGMLRARAASIWPWEQYTFVPVGACSCYAIRASNDRYVSAELGAAGLLTGMLRARATVIGPWEEFDIAHGPRPTVTAIDNGTPGLPPNLVFVGAPVTISGTGFSTAATTFDFGAANPATNVTCSSTTRCVATVPPYPAGSTVDVVATVDGLTSSPNPPRDQVVYFAGIPCCPS